jgi:hypothetical protein
MNEESVDWFANNSGVLDVTMRIHKEPPVVDREAAPQIAQSLQLDRSVPENR